MAEKSSFFTSLNGDRKYKASDFAEYFRTFIGNGVFPNPSSNLQVISNRDMTLTISPGFAWINGYMYNNTDNLILTLDNSDSALKRIDRVVIKCDFVNREIKAYIKKGVFSQSPAAPELTRDADAYELSVADILVENGIVSIQQSKITDTRLNSEVCGIVTQTVETIDTTELFNKLQAYIEERGKDVEGWINEAIQTWSMDFTTWFDSIKDILNGDIAGELANRILELEDKVGSGLTANNILMEDGSTVEDTVTENKTNISSLQTKVNNGQNHKVTNDNGTGIQISESDLNELKKCGSYYGWGLKNTPSDSTAWFYVEVLVRDSNYVYQRLTGLNDSNMAKYERICRNGTWENWREL